MSIWGLISLTAGAEPCHQIKQCVTASGTAKTQVLTVCSSFTEFLELAALLFVRFRF
jgi:hypothetical protein